MTQTVLILGGSGKIGRHATQAFLAAGWNVRQFNRKTDDMTQSALGADVIVNGLNPPNYHNWAKLIPEITAQVIAAAKASGAAVVIPGNIYNYGNQPGVLDENTPQRAQTRKGKIRIAMEQSYRAAGVQTIILRAGNFIDPSSADDLFRQVLLKSLAKGKIASLGQPDAMQAYAYLPDWARAAVMLAEKRDQLAQFEDVPFEGHAFSMRELADFAAAQRGKPVRIGGFPWWLMTIAAPVWELAREMAEMRYLYDMPHTISAAKRSRLLPDFVPTPKEDVLAGLLRQGNPNQTMRTGSSAVDA